MEPSSLSRTSKRGLLILLAAGWMVMVSPLTAEGVAGSSAFGESARLSSAPFVGGKDAVTSDPQPQVSAAPGGSSSRDALPAAVSMPLTGAVLRTGGIGVSAFSRMPEAVATRGTAEVAGTSLTLGEAIPLLTLDVLAVRSDAVIDGLCHAGLIVTGSTELTGVTAGGSLGRGLEVPSHPAPNTVLLDAAGVRIVLNEQERKGDGAASEAIEVTAVHVYLRNALLPGLGLLSGDIVIARSKAAVECPPEGPPPVADLVLASREAPASVAPGGQLTYTFTVTNQGPDMAAALFFSDTLPAGLGAVSALATQGSCSSGTPVICTLGDLAVGDSVDVTVVGRLSPTAVRLENRAAVTSAAADPDGASNSLILKTRVGRR